jgi:alpha-glucuronidase
VKPLALSRREFMAAGLAGAAGFCAGGATAADSPTPPAVFPPEEDGYKLWLRYAPPGKAAEAYRRTVRQVFVEGNSATARLIRNELGSAIASMLGAAVPADPNGLANHAVAVGTPGNSPAIRGLGWQSELAELGPEGFLIRSATVAKQAVIAIASEGEIGALYGAFHFLRRMQTGRTIDRLNVSERPKVQLRLLNHWDNLNGSIERGYAGRSLWQWSDLPDKLSPRYVDYARANASIGVNGAVINNVNADVRILAPEYLRKVAALAEVWRPYGVRMYLSANFAAPVRLGGLATADPLDAGVADWWKAKAAEIYSLIPDFGGFLVKANSEGQPGPKDYG